MSRSELAAWCVTITDPKEEEMSTEEEVGADALDPASPIDLYEYRCPECGHGDALYASAGLVVYGRIGDGGYMDLSDVEEVEQEGPDLGSIECDHHEDVEIEARWRDRGVWFTQRDLDRLQPPEEETPLKAAKRAYAARKSLSQQLTEAVREARKTHSLAEIAQELGVSRQRIHQISTEEK